MNAENAHVYRYHTVIPISYQLADSGLWVPKAQVRRSLGDQELMKTVTGDASKPFQTKAQADAESIRLAEAWLNANVH